MNSKKMLYSILTLAVVGVTGLAVAGSVSAYQGDYTQKGPNCTTERHEAMQKAINNVDYESWKNLMVGKGYVNQVINKDNFAKFAQAHKLAEQGKYAEADVIRKELGLRTSDGQNVGTGSQYGQGRGRMNK